MGSSLLKIAGIINLRGPTLRARKSYEPLIKGTYSSANRSYSAADCECDCDCQGTDCSECGGGDCSDCDCTSDTHD